MTQNNNRANNSEPLTASEDVEILNSLGLSLAEAKVFLALTRIGPATANIISKNSTVPREFIYRIMPKLLKRGLVEVLITVPKKFTAISLEEAYKILLQRKEQENKRLYSKAMEALRKHKQRKYSPVAEDFQTTLVPSREAPDVRIGQEYQRVKNSIGLVFPVEKIIQWSRYYAQICLREIIKRNVKMRIITQCELPKIMKTHSKIFTASFRAKLKHVDIRCFDESFLVEMMIFDMKTLFVSTTNEADINKMIWLRTTNPSVVEMAKGYFEAMWEKATES